jgi:hypothetical protein
VPGPVQRSGEEAGQVPRHAAYLVNKLAGH